MIDQQTTQKQNQLTIEFEKRTMLSKSVPQVGA